MKLSEVVAQPVGMPISNLYARVIAAYKTREVNTTYGVKYIQDLTISDDTMSEVKLTWWAPTMDNASMKGQIIFVNARLNGKGQMSGAVVKQDKDKDGNPRVQLNVTGDHLLLCDAQGKPMAATAPAMPQAPQAPQFMPPPAGVPAGPSAVASIPPPPEPHWEQSQAPQAPAVGKLTESQLYALAERACGRFVELFTFRGVPVEGSAIAACVNTVLIAATQRNLTVEHDLDKPMGNDPDAPPF